MFLNRTENVKMNVTIVFLTAFTATNFVRVDSDGRGIFGKHDMTTDKDNTMRSGTRAYGWSQSPSKSSPRDGIAKETAKAYNKASDTAPRSILKDPTKPKTEKRVNVQPDATVIEYERDPERFRLKSFYPLKAYVSKKYSPKKSETYPRGR